MTELPRERDQSGANASELEYHALLRAGSRPVWLGLVGIPLMLGFTFVIAPGVVTLPFMAWFALTDQPMLASLDRLVDLGDPTPMSLAYLNLVLATAIPVAWLLVRALHGLKPRWLASVQPRIRWRYFGVCLSLSVVALLVTIVVASLLPGEEIAGDVTGELRPFTDQMRDFILVVLLLTPLQAAGEEYAFRGYLAQAVGSMAESAMGVLLGRALAVLVPALLFALAHGAGQSVPIFFDRFAFGIVAGVLVLVTGGLEAAIAMHVLNNFVAFGLALAFSDMATALNPTGGSWWMIPTTLTQSLTYFALAWWAARKMGLGRVADPAVLAAGSSLVYRFSSARPDSSGGA